MFIKPLKGNVSGSDSIFLRYESEDLKKKWKKKYLQNLGWFLVCVYKLCMIKCIGIAP